MIGHTVSHYRIIEKLGEGGMGVVYLAEDKHLARRVAIKFLSSTDRHYRARFIREARAVSALNHPNIATVHDYGETDSGQPFIVMEFIKGKTLSDILEDGITMRRAVEIVSAMAEALSEAHEHGIVHRDIKPSNVVINERGQVKVLDFGLVKNLFDQPSNSVDLDADTLYSTQTRSDVIVGTPLYLSPEQATGKEIDGRSDIFALGALLYEALTGQSAFSGASILEIGAQIIHVTPPPPSQWNKSIPRELDRITMKALEKKVEARYQSAGDLLKDLHAVVGTLPGNGIPISSKNSSSSTVDKKRMTSALATLTTSLRRERFSLTGIIAAVLITGLVLWAVYHFWPRSYYQPSASALNWYERGTDGLRNGAYYQASKMLEQAVAIDSNYTLARARLAQAWTELDYLDKAKDELLAIDRSSLSPKDALYLDAITSTVRRDFAGAVKAYEQITKSSPNDSQLLVDLGYAYENNGNVDKALENYLKSVAATNGQYATAYLRAGIIYSRKQNSDQAKDFFDKAEQLYKIESNDEGVNEVRRQRGVLYRDQGRYDEARAQFQSSLDAARTLGNPAQQINALIELSYLSSTKGAISESADYAEQAVKFAQLEHLENLAAGGLLELGNSYSGNGDFTNAEKYYKQTIDLAQANKGKRREAQARLNLGALYINQLQTEIGLELVQQALAFFQQGNYSRDVSRCFTQIARAKRRQGAYDEAIESLNQKLQIAQQGGGQVQVADCYTEIGAVLFDQERYPEALQRYEQARSIYQAVDNRIKLVYGDANRANILWRLGRIDEAKKLLNETATHGEGEDKRLLPALDLIAAQISMSEGDFNNAIQKANQAMSLAVGNNYRDTAIEATYTLALAKAYTGATKNAQTLCADAARMAGESRDNTLLSRALLAQAEVALHNGDAQTALTLATQARERFAHGVQLESEWRASLIAAQACKKLSDNVKHDQYRTEAQNILSRLQQSWGEEAFKLYIARPDIQSYQKQLI
ncbi:MAG TPA: tetratricopeptide repeat protein [Pyrinomonadaceae bacterium]|nr:tetratricopeptide repeat protein [Pyrinomonadaceae bacterium]